MGCGDDVGWKKKSRQKHHDAHLGFSLRATLHTKKISNV
jgi:hypothetical protein